MAEQLRIWAGLQGFLSLAALVALVLFFLLATPFTSVQTQWMWLGPVNDWLSVFSAVPWIVAMIVLTLRINAGTGLWILTLLACLGVTALAVVTLLMLAGRASLQAQSVIAVVAMTVALAWGAVAAPAASRAAAIPPWLSFFAIGLLVAFILGAVLAGVGYLLHAGSSAQMPLYIVAATVGGLAWCAFPVWWLAVASTAR
ncbi:hypothetical protein [Diaminobutyricimonas sp. LJ205]|uniref:hypothetical protein n=1 Tax=Diaminobutyricimonas sp. LJ205 TaxID=2683590 RepID=UPI001E4FA84F|nr:hypothetical protein [Diaminobutyricimonas sp. LJ205]